MPRVIELWKEFGERWREKLVDKLSNTRLSKACQMNIGNGLDGPRVGGFRLHPLNNPNKWNYPCLWVSIFFLQFSQQDTSGSNCIPLKVLFSFCPDHERELTRTHWHFPSTKRSISPLMGKIFQSFISAERIYTCACCSAHFCQHEDLVSKAFMGHHGRAYLFRTLENVVVGHTEDRLLITGVHSVADLHCTCS